MNVFILSGSGGLPHILSFRLLVKIADEGPLRRCDRIINHSQLFAEHFLEVLISLGLSLE